MQAKQLFCLGSLALMLVACQPKTETETHTHTQNETMAETHSAQTTHGDHGSHAAAANVQTQIEQVDGYQVSFDITTMAAHHDMMDAMKMTMDADHMAAMQAGTAPSHYVMVTLLDAERRPVKDAPLKLKVIGPDGEALLDAAGVDAETMAAEDMFHYGHGFDLSAPGRYQVLVMFAADGKPHQTGVFWEQAHHD